MLNRLPNDEYRRLLPHLERVRLALKQVLYQPGDRVTHVHFPIDSIVSLLTVMADGTAIETGMIGPEGMVGLPVFLGTDVGDARAVCQLAGDAWRLPADALLAEVGRRGQLPAVLARYTQGALRQVAQVAACNGLHGLEARCARWLLMVADRVGSDRFAMTQQFLSEMLGVRRATVVLAMGLHQRAGRLQHGYGQVTILDRPALAAAACECYVVLKRELDHASLQAAHSAPRRDDSTLGMQDAAAAGS
jgi:CRP-like cAMP-binding protein